MNLLTEIFSCQKIEEAYQFESQSDLNIALQHMHPNRKLGYLASRSALLKALHRSCHNADWNTLEIIDHQYLRHYPHWVASLAHTKNVGVATIAQAADCQSVGVDIEFTNREVKPELLKYFIIEADESWGQEDPLKLWVVKEACYKALSPLLFNHKSGLQSFYIKGSAQGGSFTHLESHELTGMYQMEMFSHNGHKLMVATAWVPH